MPGRVDGSSRPRGDRYRLRFRARSGCCYLSPRGRRALCGHSVAACMAVHPTVLTNRGWSRKFTTFV